MKNGTYRVEVHSYAEEPRRVVVWRRGPAGPWIIWGSLAVPDGIDAKALEAEVIKRLPEPVAQCASDRVYLKLWEGLGRTA